MSIIGNIIKRSDGFVFSYGISVAEGKNVVKVKGKTLESVLVKWKRLLRIEQSAERLYDFYGKGYYTGRFAQLKPVLEELFTVEDFTVEDAPRSWYAVDDWLWEVYEESADLDYFTYEIIQFFARDLNTEGICCSSCRTVRSQERKIEFLEDSLEKMGEMEVLCMVRIMKETGIRLGDLENIEWNHIIWDSSARDKIQPPYVTGVMQKKVMSHYPAAQVSKETYKLLNQLTKNHEKVFCKRKAAVQIIIRKAIANEFEFMIHNLRWYWNNRRKGAGS